MLMLFNKYVTPIGIKPSFFLSIDSVEGTKSYLKSQKRNIVTLASYGKQTVKIIQSQK